MPWKVYTDAACTQQFSGTLTFSHFTDLSDGSQDALLYWAEVEEDVGNNGILVLQTKTNPGVNNITLTPTDASPGSGHEATEIKLATTAAGLDTANAGAAVSLGHTLTSGLNGKREIHVRVTNAVQTRGNSTELSFDHPELAQFDA